MQHHLTGPWPNQPHLRQLCELLVPATIPTFVLIAGLQDASVRAADLARLLRQAITLFSLGVVAFYYLPHITASLCGIAYGQVAQRELLMHLWTFQWFFFVLATYKLSRFAMAATYQAIVDAAITRHRTPASFRENVSANVVMAGIALLVHFGFGCATLNEPVWP